MFWFLCCAIAFVVRAGASFSRAGDNDIEVVAQITTEGDIEAIAHTTGHAPLNNNNNREDYIAPPGDTATSHDAGWRSYFWPAGLVLSALALSKIKKTGNGGHGLALAGLIISIGGAVASVIAIIAFVVAIISAQNGLSDAADELERNMAEDAAADVSKAKRYQVLIWKILDHLARDVGESSYTGTMTAIRIRYCLV